MPQVVEFVMDWVQSSSFVLRVVVQPIIVQEEPLDMLHCLGMLRVRRNDSCTPEDTVHLYQVVDASQSVFMLVRTVVKVAAELFQDWEEVQGFCSLC